MAMQIKRTTTHGRLSLLLAAPSNATYHLTVVAH